VFSGALTFPAGRPTPAVVAEVFTHAASMAVSAVLAVAAIALVLVLPKKVARGH
jgi:hypothetical protein